MAMNRNRLPSGVIKEQERIAQQHKTSWPSNWPDSERPKPPFKEGDPIRKTNAGHSQKRADISTTTNPAGNPFDDLNGAHTEDTNTFTYWTCPRCQSQWRKSSERLMNLRRTGRYFFQCENTNCRAQLVVTRRKDSGLDTIDELREPFVEGELTVLGKRETVSTPEVPKKIKKRRRITRKLLRAKKSFTKSKHYVHETGRVVKDGLARLTGFRTDTDTSDPDTATVRRPSEFSRLDPQGEPGVLSRVTIRHPNRPRTPQKPTKLGPKPKIPPGDIHMTSSKPKLVNKPSNLKNPFISVHPLNTTVAGSQSQISQETNQKGKQPTTNNLILSCRCCAASFRGDDAGEDALRQHVKAQHRDQGGSQSVQGKSKKLVEGPPDGEEDDEDDDELFVSCRIARCRRTFGSDDQRLKHQEEEHPGEAETFPKCRVCLASFPTRTIRDKHEEKKHADWYENTFRVPI